MVNKIERMFKVHNNIHFARAEETLPVDKYAWKCDECQRIWMMKQDAERCNHKDSTFYGSKVIFCLGKDFPIQQFAIWELPGIRAFKNTNIL